jgi:serine phosphatase RsbU (regulator of sigma subunit)
MEAGRYSTLFYALYDDTAGTLTYVNAGHPPPVLARCAAGGAAEIRLLEASMPPVGLFPHCAPRAQTIRMQRGDWLVAFSDGVTEAINAAGDEFGRDRIAETIRANPHLSADAMRDLLHAAVRDHAAGQPQFDDLTIIVGRSR